MKFVKIDLEYIKYLYQFDNRVQYSTSYSDSKNSNRPYIGTVLKINGNNYFAPLEHPRPEHCRLKNNLHIFKIDNGKLGIIGLNNMLPVPNSAIVEFDINEERNKKILIRQFVYCRKNQRNIINRAQKAYEKRINKPNSFEKKIFCDYLLLEQKCQEYQAMAQQPILPNQIIVEQCFNGITQSF